MGMVAAARLSRLKGHAGSDLVDRVEAVVNHIGLEIRLPGHLQPGDVLSGMRHDKKRRHSKLRFVLLKDVGSPFVADDVTDEEVLEVLDGMHERTSRRIP